MVSAGSRELERVEVGRVPIAYRRCGPRAASTVLLVHGGAAHSGWWDGVAPVLAEDHQVVLLDLGGHGESGHRPAYTAELWAAEIAAVLRATTDRPAAVVGHSMGGLVGVAAAARSPELVGSLVLVDTRLPLRGLPAPDSPARVFGSDTEALDRFRLLPDRTHADPATLRSLARTGLVRVPTGWRWRFDPRARRRLTNDGVRADLAAVRCGVGYAYGADSDMGGAASHAVLEEWLGRPVPVEVVPGAFHHVPLDQPGLCASALLRLLGSLDSRP